MSKLNNIKAVKEMLGGEHKKQNKKTISFTDKVIKRREVGETWTDDKGQKWEQRKGYKVKVGKLSELRTELREFPNCNRENSSCNCTEPGTADLKMKAIHGMCLDCVTLMEYDLKQKGEYEEYERKKMLANAEAWLKQAEVEKEVLKTTLKASFVNEDGSIEEWAEGMSEDELVSKIDNDFEKFRTDFIGKLKNEQTTD